MELNEALRRTLKFLDWQKSNRHSVFNETARECGDMTSAMDAILTYLEPPSYHKGLAIVLQVSGAIHKVLVHPSRGLDADYSYDRLKLRFLQAIIGDDVKPVGEYLRNTPRYEQNNQFAEWLKALGFREVVYSVG